MEKYKMTIAKKLINGFWVLNSTREYAQISKISEAVDYAWNNWDEAVLKTYYEGEKPEQPTEEFINHWIENEDFEADGYDVDALKEIFA
ncbi:hypothetical protein [Rhodonellum sp.]|uniref:hypothetical protein n=1 Tax=Rhodonellum sp. TaxID=2231180 RepID=UPI002727ACC2|nr:hypothetical protein [Rhodonellum sp.]MDO9554546.1 hypothetical protein [Rhodonellum sp.]